MRGVGEKILRSSDIDDVPPTGEALLGRDELARMNENDWVLLKNELQEYLYRAEQTENPAYESTGIVGWLDENGDHFNRFYQHLRSTKPELLLQWRARALDENEMNDAEFISTWVVFRDKEKLQ